MKCITCREPFTKSRPLQRACSPLCAIKLAQAKRLKAERQADRVKRKALRPRSEWLSLAQTAVNRYVRLRDAHLGCVSCGAMPDSKFGGTMDCGHYRSRGSAPHLRFHLWNMAAQCVKCNRYGAGMADRFRAGLIARHGKERVEALESMQWLAKFTPQYLQRLRAVFTRKAKRLEKRMAA